MLLEARPPRPSTRPGEGRCPQGTGRAGGDGVGPSDPAHTYPRTWLSFCLSRTQILEPSEVHFVQCKGPLRSLFFFFSFFFKTFGFTFFFFFF